jgi:hypothetical protein
MAVTAEGWFGGAGTVSFRGFVLAAAVLLLVPGTAVAQSQAAGASPVDSAQEDRDLAKELQNPVASLISLPFQFNYNTGFGPRERTFFNLNVQPVVPFAGEKWNFIARAIMPINSLPVGEVDSTFGIGDTGLSVYMSPAEPGKIIWGVGPSLLLPTASNPERLGTEKLGLGASAVALMQPGKWTIGALATNVWSVAGSSDRDDYSLLTLQYFLTYNFGEGWALGTSPIITANWKADSDQRWTVPFGLQLSKVTMLGSRPTNISLGYYTNSERPDGAPSGVVRFQMTLMFPTGS